MKKLALAIATSFIALGTFAQDNNIKLNLLNLVNPITLGDLRLGYERKLTDNMTAQANVGLFIPRKLPTVFFDEDAVEDYGGTVDVENRLSGYNFSLELRFYPGEKEAPRGFYLAPYLKYNRWNALVSTSFDYEATDEEYADLTVAQQKTVTSSGNPDRPHLLEATGEFKGGISQAGGGLMIGYQWVINDQISIDWNFFGLGVESVSSDLTLTTDAVDVDYLEWKAEIEEGTEDFADFADVEVEAKSDEINVKFGPFLVPSPRIGFSIGYTF